MELIKIGVIPFIIKKRRHNTSNEINQYLKNYKNKSIKKIAKELNLPKTQVEHYFRTDKSRTIPIPQVWLKLKKILKLNNQYDKIVMEMCEKEMTYEISKRYYDCRGISPTLMGKNSPYVLIYCKKGKLK